MARPNRKAEADVEEDHQQAHTRATTPAGSPEAVRPTKERNAAETGVTVDAPRDRYSTTGTTPNDTFVGRAAGDDAGVAEETGAERRAQDQHRTQP
jgi:hypothetical protein